VPKSCQALPRAETLLITQSDVFGQVQLSGRIFMLREARKQKLSAGLRARRGKGLR
jgi:hypothetical protein